MGARTAQVETLEAAREAEAVRLLGRAFVTNPLHVAALGADQLARNEAMFRMALPLLKGTKLAAFDDSRMVGVIHWIESPRCQLSVVERLRILPFMIRSLGLARARRVAAWLSVWSEHDPKEPHVHLGPIGVLPEAQGRRIGRALMERYCAHQDATGHMGYLETDRPGNVEFYRRFGFETSETVAVLGVTNYFMRRQPAAS